MEVLVDYPQEWRKHMIKGKTRTFSKNTPQEIVNKAKEINKETIRTGGKPFFFFDED
ncbi:hypothetical protein [uncultured Ruminococcus sp.]|uniref:hypothetical protein n=1 Tax=uncultured Ruminococcus sp. TaxID=165186 RepID=UPI00262C9001|nr:hypothetical protein [uncultured Ruminococcus sp.]